MPEKLKMRFAPGLVSGALPPAAYEKGSAPFVGRGLDKVARQGGRGDVVCTKRDTCACPPCAKGRRLNEEALAVLASRSLIYRGDGLREDAAQAKRRLEAANTRALLAEQERQRIAREGMLQARTRVLKPGCRVDPGVAKVKSTFRGVEALRDFSGLEKQGRWE